MKFRSNAAYRARKRMTIVIYGPVTRVGIAIVQTTAHFSENIGNGSLTVVQSELENILYRKGDYLDFPASTRLDGALRQGFDDQESFDLARERIDALLTKYRYRRVK